MEGGFNIANLRDPERSINKLGYFLAAGGLGDGRGDTFNIFQ